MGKLHAAEGSHSVVEAWLASEQCAPYLYVCSTRLVYCRVYEGSSCAVCLGDYEDGEMIRQLPDCHHHFHLDCIDQWLATHTTCPMCRRSLLPPDPNAETPVSPSGSPTAHLLPLWASSARGRQHQQLAVELRPVSCPSSISHLLHGRKDGDTFQTNVAHRLACASCIRENQKLVCRHIQPRPCVMAAMLPCTAAPVSMSLCTFVQQLLLGNCMYATTTLCFCAICLVLGLVNDWCDADESAPSDR